MSRTFTIVVLSVALSAATSGPAIAAPTTTKPTATKHGLAQICPGILCEPFWKTDRARILKKEP